MFGPLIGGALVDWDLFGSGWRLVFLVNVPIGIGAVVGAYRLLPASIHDRSIRLDLGGTALMVLFAVLLVYPLIEGREHGWPWWAYAALALGLILMMSFGLHQRYRARRGLDPLVTPSVFAHRGYSGGLLFAVLFFAGLGGTLLCAFDIVLAAVTDRETGSASGVLNAGQQLATSVGIAVFGTIFFDAIAGGDFHSGLTRAMVVEAVTMLGLVFVAPILPRYARDPEAPASLADASVAA